MPHIQLDVTFLTHPKVMGLSPLAQLLHIRGIIYACQHLTDGFLAAASIQVLALGYEDEEYQTSLQHADVLIKELLRAGMWEKSDDGYQIHDYLDYHLSKTQVLQLRKNKRKAGQAGGRAKALAHASDLLENGASSLSRSASSKTCPNTNTNLNSLSSLSSLSSLPSVSLLTSYSEDEVLQLWNEHGLIACKKLSGPIKQRVASRLREHPDRQWWVTLFARVRASDFLAGRKTDFVATLDWVVGPKNLAKIEAGNYDNRASGVEAMKEAFLRA